MEFFFIEPFPINVSIECGISGGKRNSFIPFIFLLGCMHNKFFNTQYELSFKFKQAIYLKTYS